MSTISSHQHEAPTDPLTLDVIRLVLPRQTHITSEIAEATAAQARSEADGFQRPILLVITGVQSISREARAVFSRSQSASAIAVVGESPVDRVIANFLLGGTPPPCPTRFFTAEESAVAWLKDAAGEL